MEEPSSTTLIIKENPRHKLEENNKRLIQTISNKIVECKNGIKKLNLKPRNLFITWKSKLQIWLNYFKTNNQKEKILICELFFNLI